LAERAGPRARVVRGGVEKGCPARQNVSVLGYGTLQESGRQFPGVQDAAGADDEVLASVDLDGDRRIADAAMAACQSVEPSLVRSAEGVPLPSPVKVTPESVRQDARAAAVVDLVVPRILSGL